jgi:hypothetical protein
MRLALAAALVVSLLAAALATPARADTSAGPEIELYTMGPGPTLPERFGHAALCVRYPDRRAPDLCYDYGAFDASEPLKLGYRFLRGESVFFVAVRRPESMVRDYVGRDRTVWRQRLPLPPEQARRVASIVETDAQPENRYYHYHHYFDNCATRVRDIIDEVTAGALSSLADDEREQRTFRDFTREGFAEFPWLLAASDLAIGRAVDVRADAYERMFLPEMLREGVEEALRAPADVIYERRAEPFPSEPQSGSPFFPVAGILMFASISLSTMWRRGERAVIAVAAFPLALLGLILWSAAIISPLPEVRFNELLLVFMPTDAALAFLSERRRQLYATARAGLIGVVLLLSLLGVFVQPILFAATLALAVMLAIGVAPGWRAWRRQRGSGTRSMK